MKKVGILALHLGYGGIEKSIVSLANMLCNNYDVEIAVVYRLYKKSVFELDDRVHVKYLTNVKPNKEELKEAITSFRLIKTIKESFYSAKVLYLRKKNMVQYIIHSNCDVIISTRDIFNYWLCGYGRSNILKIGWEHNHFHNDYKYANNIYRSARKLDYLVLVSSQLQKFYSSKLKNTSCMCLYIPNSIDKIPEKTATLKEKRIISVGRLSPEKGFIDLLEIFSRLHKTYADWHLDIVGDGSEKSKLEKYIKKKDLEEYITLHGFQGKKYIDELYNKSSIYVMTSHTESFGIVLIEAMSHGIPCIAYDSAEGARELIISGKNGFLIKNRNIDAMVMKIGSLIDQYETRVRIGKNARKSVMQFTSENILDEWITLIEESDIYD